MQADLSVNAGTLSNFAGSGRDFTVDVTAPTTGTGNINLQIALDAVSVGNAATSATIAYSALPTATITFADDALAHGASTIATIVWSEIVTGFVIGGLSVNVGSLSNFSGSGTTYTVEVTAPATGSGALTLEIALDSVCRSATPLSSRELTIRLN